MILFCGIAYTYYRQLLDPLSTRAPVGPSSSSAAPGPYDTDAVAFPEHYNPPYLAYNSPYAPPAGPPPGFAAAVDVDKDSDAFKPPVYDPVDGPTGYLDAKHSDDGHSVREPDDPFADFDGPVRKVDSSREALV